MEQTTININQQLAYLMSTGKWRNCQRKAYNVFAIQPEAGFVFANRLKQPEQFKYIKQRFGKAVVHTSQLTEEDKDALGQNCYVTDGQRVVICGTRGELWAVKPEKLAASYTKTDGSPITEMPKQWKEFSRAQENAPSAKGIQIPKQYLGVYQASWGTLTMNDHHSPGHFTGDILVVSMDGKDVSTVNNEVFACTFNQQVGGWAQSGCITPVDKIKEIKLEDVMKTYSFEASARVKKAMGDWKVTELHKCGATVLWYVLQNRDGHVEDRVSKETVVSYIKENNVVNARMQTYQGRDIVRLADGTYQIVEEAINTNTAAPDSRKDAQARITIIWKKDPNGNAVGYTINYKGKDTKVTKNRLIEYIKENRIANARIQNYNGRDIVRLTDKNIEVKLIDGGDVSSIPVKEEKAEEPDALAIYLADGKKIDKAIASNDSALAESVCRKIARDVVVRVAKRHANIVNTEDLRDFDLTDMDGVNIYPKDLNNNNYFVSIDFNERKGFKVTLNYFSSADEDAIEKDDKFIRCKTSEPSSLGDTHEVGKTMKALEKCIEGYVTRYLK